MRLIDWNSFYLGSLLTLVCFVFVAAISGLVGF